MITPQQYDAIIIGSGQAGTPLATTLAQAGSGRSFAIFWQLFQLERNGAFLRVARRTMLKKCWTEASETK